jgi:hypothetical protein
MDDQISAPRTLRILSVSSSYYDYQTQRRPATSARGSAIAPTRLLAAAGRLPSGTARASSRRRRMHHDCAGASSIKP